MEHEFGVEPGALFQLRQALQRAHEHGVVSGDVDQMLSDLTTALSTSAETAGMTASAYEATDQSAAARYDRENFTARHGEVDNYEDAIAEAGSEVAPSPDPAVPDSADPSRR